MKIFFIRIIYNLEFYKIILLRKLLTSEYVVNSLRTVYKYNISKILLYYGAIIGSNCHFKGLLNIDNCSYDKKLFINLLVGKNCYIGKNVYLDLANEIDIKDDVVISNNVIILTHADVGARKMSKYYKRVSKKLIVDEGTWIGANSVILPGIKIGKFCIIAAGSVVNKDVEDFTLVAGVPAKLKKRLNFNEYSDNWK